MTVIGGHEGVCNKMDLKYGYGIHGSGDENKAII